MDTKIELLGNDDLYHELLEQYIKFKDDLNILLPIKFTIDNINQSMVNREIINLNNAVLIKEAMLTLEQQYLQHQPTIHLYCRDGTPIYQLKNFIRS